MFEEFDLGLQLMLLVTNFILFIIRAFDSSFIVLSGVSDFVLALLDHVFTRTDHFGSPKFFTLDVRAHLPLLSFLLFDLLEKLV